MPKSTKKETLYVLKPRFLDLRFASNGLKEVAIALILDGLLSELERRLIGAYPSVPEL